MNNSKSYIDKSFSNALKQLIFMSLGLGLFFTLPIFSLMIPLLILLFISLFFGIISLFYLFKGRKESNNYKKIISFVLSVFTIILVLFYCTLLLNI